jgi:replication fork protection complex subunit Tof1/Swi1
MKRVVGLLHRQAVRAKAEGLFFKVRDSSHWEVELSEHARDRSPLSISSNLSWPNRNRYPVVSRTRISCSSSTTYSDNSSRPWKRNLFLLWRFVSLGLHSNRNLIAWWFKAFFPKNRGQWKNFSSWEPEKKEQKAKAGGGRDDTVCYHCCIEISSSHPARS